MGAHTAFFFVRQFLEIGRFSSCANLFPIFFVNSFFSVFCSAHRLPIFYTFSDYFSLFLYAQFSIKFPFDVCRKLWWKSNIWLYRFLIAWKSSIITTYQRNEQPIQRRGFPLLAIFFLLGHFFFIYFFFKYVCFLNVFSPTKNVGFFVGVSWPFFFASPTTGNP